MALVINQRERKDVVVLKLNGKLIFGEECDAFNQQIKDLQNADKVKIVLKLEGVKYCDSAGLDGLVRALMLARNRNGDVKLVKPSQKVQDLMDLTKLGKVFDMHNLLGRTKLGIVFDIHSTEDEAVASFK